MSRNKGNDLNKYWICCGRTYPITEGQCFCCGRYFTQKDAMKNAVIVGKANSLATYLPVSIGGTK